MGSQRLLRLGTMGAVCVAGWAAGLVRGAEPSEVLATGRSVGCEHFAFVRARVPEGLSGPAREAAKSWHVSMCVAPDGAAYVLDAENCQLQRVQDGTVRLLARGRCWGH
jgi:hypothetical protein